VAALRETGLQVDIRETCAAGEATEIARAAYSQGIRHFIAVGGDGTGFEIVNGLFPEAIDAAERPTLGFLPLGTGNSFLRDFSSEGAEHARRALTSGLTRPVDVIRLDHKQGSLFYINILSLGFVADVCAVTNRRFKSFGEAGYGLGVIVTVAGLACCPLPMRLDGGAFDNEAVAFVSINNSRFTGGKMMMAPGADAADGLVDIVRVGELGRLAFLRTFPKVFDGSHVRHPAVSTQQARKIEFALTKPLDAMIDGEVIRLWPTQLEVLHHKLEVHA
jgi:YegS/Rv2252/BmrU family lipid kinase